jgi:hypothetical protein
MPKKGCVMLPIILSRKAKYILEKAHHREKEIIMEGDFMNGLGKIVLK